MAEQSSTHLSDKKRVLTLDISPEGEYIYYIRVDDNFLA